MTLEGWIHRAPPVLRLLTALIVTVLASFVASPPAHAESLYDSGSAGFDISFPQCSNVNVINQIVLDIPYEFGIIGVNQGRAFVPSKCLASEIEYVVSQGIPISFVINLNAPRGNTAPFGSGQIAFADGCAPGDDECAHYSYGWIAAQDAYRNTQQTLQSLGISSLPSKWWMDIEVANYWSANPALNDQVIQGAIDFIQQNIEGGEIGIYSTQSTWNAIAGRGYQPGVPVWQAGAKSAASASRLCMTTSFTGGPIELVQYATRLLDIDFAC